MPPFPLHARRTRWALASLPAWLPFWLAGCASSVTQPQGDAAPAVTTYRSVSADAQLAVQAQALPADWWALFQDPLLTQLVQDALASNLDLQATLTRLDQGRAALGITEALDGPQLSAEGSYSRSAISANSPLHHIGASTKPFDTWVMGLQAQWEIDFWGHQRRQVESAQASLQASQEATQAMRVSVAAEVTRQYVLLRGTQARQALAHDLVDTAQARVRVQTSRLNNGVATQADTAAARAELAVAQAQATALDQQADSLLNALALLLARPPQALDAALRAPTAKLQLPASLPVGLPSELAHQRPDILEAEARLRAALADVGVARADFYPRVALTGVAGTQAFHLDDLGSWGDSRFFSWGDSRFFSWGPVFHLPIFDGGRLQRQLALTEARQRSAAIAYRQTVLRAWHEVDDALANLNTGRTRLTLLGAANGERQTALHAQERARQQGAADDGQVLQARQAWLMSQGALTEGQTAQALSVVSLYRALGGGRLPPSNTTTVSAQAHGQQSETHP